MIRSITTNILSLLLVFFITNLSFIYLHYAAERLTSRELAEERFSQAFADGHITAEQYPFLTFGKGAIQNLDGIDQYSECVNALMTIFRLDNHPWQNAINPGWHSFVPEQYCDALKLILVNHQDVRQATINTKPRLWSGAKAVTLLFLPFFEISQLYPFLKQLTYLGFALLLALAFAHSRQMGWTMLPISIIGILGSGIAYYGGIANALPFAVALYLGLGEAVVITSQRTCLKKCYALAAGSIMAFVYLTDGSLILAFSLFIYATYFLGGKERTLGQRWKDLIVLTSLFFLGFVLSLLFKQLAAAMIIDFQTVWQEFVEAISLRISTKGGPDWNRWQAFYGQFGAYQLAVLWNLTLYWTITSLSCAGWIAAVILTSINTALNRSLEHCSVLVVFCGIVLVAFCRYYFMTNHSFEHWFIVCRYVFIVHATGIGAAIYSGYTLQALLRKKRMESP
jgi:hypothetical protein